MRKQENINWKYMDATQMFKLEAALRSVETREQFEVALVNLIKGKLIEEDTSSIKLQSLQLSYHRYLKKFYGTSSAMKAIESLLSTYPNMKIIKVKGGYAITYWDEDTLAASHAREILTFRKYVNSCIATGTFGERKSNAWGQAMLDFGRDLLTKLEANNTYKAADFMETFDMYRNEYKEEIFPTPDKKLDTEQAAENTEENQNESKSVNKIDGSEWLNKYLNS